MRPFLSSFLGRFLHLVRLVYGIVSLASLLREHYLFCQSCRHVFPSTALLSGHYVPPLSHRVSAFQGFQPASCSGEAHPEQSERNVGQLRRFTIQYNITLLPSVNTLIARGMFCSAKYTHRHTFTPVIKHLITTTANKHPGKKSFIDKNMEGPTGIKLCISHKIAISQGPKLVS